MHVYLYICIHKYIYVYTYIYIYVYTYMYIYTYLDIYVYNTHIIHAHLYNDHSLSAPYPPFWPFFKRGPVRKAPMYIYI